MNASPATSKHTGPFLAFSKEWFGKHQKPLLVLLNFPLVKYWFRRVMRIRYWDCPKSEKIVEIGPNYFVYAQSLEGVSCQQFSKQAFSNRKMQRREWALHRRYKCKGDHPVLKRTADFRTHPKYAKRLYYAFKPLWLMMHAWDSVFADVFAPQLSFGFSTLTQYPNAGTGVTAVDGHAGYNGQNISFATIRAGTSANQASDTANNFNCIIRTALSSPNFAEMWRCPVCWDTSAIGSTSTISDATVSFYGGSKDSTLGGSISITAYSGSASSVATSSYNISNYSDTKLATDIAVSSWTSSAYNDYPLNASGLANINKTGISPFALRTSWDVDNTAPTHPGSQQYSYVQPSCADQSGTSNDPKLVANYFILLTKTLTETITTSDSLIRQTARVLTEIITHSDSIINVKVISKAYTESITFVETLIRTVGKVLTDPITTGDTVVRQSQRTFIETITNTDMMLKLIGKNMVLEALTLTDSIVRTVSKVLIDSITTVYTFIRRTQRSFIETITNSDMLLSSKVTYKVLTETITLTARIVLYINGLLTRYVSKYTTRGTSYSSKYSEKGTTYNDKYHSNL